VLLPNDTYRKPITSITAVLLPFETYLLTLSHTFKLFKKFSYRSPQSCGSETTLQALFLILCC
jgi:hypothetical protein